MRNALSSTKNICCPKFGTEKGEKHMKTTAYKHLYCSRFRCPQKDCKRHIYNAPRGENCAVTDIHTALICPDDAGKPFA